MKKARIIEVVVLALILLTSIPIFILTWIFSSNLLYANYIVVLVYITMVMPIALYLTEFIVEIKAVGYKSYEYLSFWTILVEIFGVAVYLILVNLVTSAHFATWRYLFFALIPLCVIIPIAITYIYGRNKAKAEHPKIIKR